MSKIGKIKRGEKWTKLSLVNPEMKENIENNPSMKEDIECYKKSLEVVEEEESKEQKDYSSMTKAEIKAILDEKETEYTGMETKDELIVLAEA